MRNLITAATIAAFASGLIAQETPQDKVTLRNGDVITGKLKTMADGKITVASPLLEDVEIPMSSISDLVTGSNVTLRVKGGTTYVDHRILGIEGGSMRLDGADTSSLALDKLDMINPPTDPVSQWSGSLKLTALYTDGNTSRKAVGLLFNAEKSTEADRLLVDALWDYGEDKDVKQFQSDGTTQNPDWRKRTLTQRRAGGAIQYDLKLTERSYVLATSRALGDTLADLQLRWTAGLGVGYTLIDDDYTTFQLEAGLSYFSEDYRTPGRASQDNLAARVAYKLEHDLSEHSRLVHRVEAYPSLEDGNDLYLQSWTELSTSLTDSMVASIAHTLNYDNTPSPGFQRVDNRVFFTVGWTF